MCWTRQSECAVTRSTTAFVSATDVKMVGKHASACRYGDDRTSSLCLYVIFLEGGHVESIVFCATGQHSILVLHSFTNLVSLQPFFVQALAGSHGLQVRYLPLADHRKKI